MRPAALSVLTLVIVASAARAQDALQERLQETLQETRWGRFEVERDSVGRARAARGPFGEVRFERDAAGRRTAIARSNGVRTRVAPGVIEHVGPGGRVVLRVERAREGDVEVVRVTGRHAREVRVARDAAGRVRDAWTWAADRPRELHVIPTRDGARVERDGATGRWVVGGEGRLVAAGDLRLTHDDRGRVVRVEGPPARGRPAFLVGYAWDDADRLVRVRRVTASGARSVVAYAWTDEGCLAERQDGRGVRTVIEGPLVRAILGPGARVRLDALDPDVPAGAPPLATCVDGVWTFLHEDGAGAVLAWTDARGDLVDEAAFSPWGEVEARPAVERPLWWAGHEVDLDAGLVLVGGRPYAPWLGRWLAPDRAAPAARAYDGDGIVGALGGASTR